MGRAEPADPLLLLRDAVAAERARSGSVKAAAATVARRVGLTPRRVLSAWWGQVVALSWAEGRRVLDAEARRAAAEIAELEARLAALRVRAGQGVGVEGSLDLVAPAAGGAPRPDAAAAGR